MSFFLLIEICFSACDMNNTRKANYQYESADFMVKNPRLTSAFKASSQAIVIHHYFFQHRQNIARNRLKKHKDLLLTSEGGPLGVIVQPITNSYLFLVGTKHKLLLCKKLAFRKNFLIMK